MCIFMQIHIFDNIIKKSKVPVENRFTCQYYGKHNILNILCIFSYYYFYINIYIYMNEYFIIFHINSYNILNEIEINFVSITFFLVSNILIDSYSKLNYTMRMTGYIIIIIFNNKVNKKSNACQ